MVDSTAWGFLRLPESRMFRRLTEAGKRHNASDQRLLQTVHDHAVSLGASCAPQESAREPVYHFAEADLSYSDITDLIRAALKLQYAGAGTWVYPRDVYPDTVVYSVSNNDDSISKLYRRSYSLTDSVVTFTSDPVEVQAVTNYVPVSESGDPLDEAEDITGDLVPLTEKAVAKDGQIKIKVIQAGQGSSGFYPDDVLKRDGPKAFTAGVHMHLDHPSASEESDRPERSVTTLAGTLTSDAAWEEHGPAGPGLYATAKVRSDIAPLIEELAPHIGVSIRALGKAGTREIGGKKVRTIEAIEQAKSVDFVTVPGAGGRVLDLMESARGRQQQGGTPPGDNDMGEAELKEAQGKITALESTIAEQGKTIARLQEANTLREARALVVEKLAAANLPKLTRDRLTETLVNGATVTDGALDTAALTAAIEAAVKDAAAELAEATAGNPIRGMGGTATTGATVPTLEESRKRIDAALAAL
jgi:hypothetical protein